MRFILLFLTAGFLSACATTAKYEAKLNTWVGKNESDLVSQWGVPNNTYSLNDGSKLIMYQHNGGSASVPIGNMYYTESYWCKTTFTIDGSGVVKNWKHEGNKCESD